jgi:hypothetical protein
LEALLLDVGKFDGRGAPQTIIACVVAIGRNQWWSGLTNAIAAG